MMTKFGDIEPQNCEWIRLHLYRTWQKSDIFDIRIDISTRLLWAYWGKLDLYEEKYSSKKWYSE